MMMAVWKFAPAIAAGNTVVLKPSDTTPVTTAAARRDRRREFLPPGVFNVVSGDRDTGRALVEHHDPAAWSPSPARSAPACRSPRRPSHDLKRVHLELGGKAPVVVFDDADIEAAAEGIAVAGYFNAGQDCTAATRVLVGAGRLRRLRRRARRAGAGDDDDVRDGPTDEDALVRPVNNANQLERVLGFLDRAARRTPSVAAGGAPAGRPRLLLRAHGRRRTCARTTR